MQRIQPTHSTEFISRALTRSIAAGACVALVAMLLVSPAFAVEPEDFPPEYGAAFPLAAIQSIVGLAFFPVAAVPTFAFEGREGVEKLWDRLVIDPIEYVTRDRSGNAEY